VVRHSRIPPVRIGGARRHASQPLSLEHSQRLEPELFDHLVLLIFENVPDVSADSRSLFDKVARTITGPRQRAKH
jgi:hypothetical protein